MFKNQNFCHVASNNRNNVKAGLFVYRTTDDLATVTASGYFNDAIIDVKLHDLIIHEKYDASDNTKVERNLLCVIEKTLENVATSIIKTKWEGDIEQAIADLETYVNNNFVKIDGSSIMTGPLKMRASESFQCAIAPSWDGVGFFKLNANNSVSLMASMESIDGLCPAADNTYNLGKTSYRWKDAHIARVITAVINNGYDIAVPVTNSADTLALKSQVDDAANSGEQLYTTGVWYAKMYAATVVPTGAEYDGRNYADFSQVDSDNNPIIVIYTGVSGAWTETTRITPPANHNGYITVTSKIWDIVEQSGQQGGFVLWAYNTKTFTPYPRIVSFDSINVTGESTVVMPLNPVPQQIVNKDYVDNALINHGTGRNVGDIFFTTRKDSSLNGAVDCDGSLYNTTDFSGAQTIGTLLEAGKLPYVSLTQYATLLSTNGSVGVFGWDGTGTTTVRVPSLNDIFIETGTSAQIGDFIAAGLPNITSNWVANNRNGSTYQPLLRDTTGAIQVGQHHDGGSSTATSSSYVGYHDYSFDASRSSAIYGNSATVQPKSVRYRAMVQVAISASDQAVETCTQVLSDVAALNTHRVIDFQAPSAQNNYTWYRKYADGWVEQGGIIPLTIPANTSTQFVANFPIAMTDTNYTFQTSLQTGWSLEVVGFAVEAKNTMNMSGFVQNTHAVSAEVQWCVSGMAA